MLYYKPSWQFHRLFELVLRKQKTCRIKDSYRSGDVITIFGSEI